MTETGLFGSCPVCGAHGEFVYETEKIPYFSEILICRMICQSCGYRYTDVQSVSSKEPVTWRFVVTNEEDLSVRVVRSMKATITIPEIGVSIDPGPGCEGFVSNIEGVIRRVDAVLDTIMLTASDSERTMAEELRKKLYDTLAGKQSLTIIIRDPLGISLIDSEKAVQESYNLEKEIR